MARTQHAHQRRLARYRTSRCAFDSYACTACELFYAYMFRLSGCASSGVLLAFYDWSAKRAAACSSLASLARKEARPPPALRTTKAAQQVGTPSTSHVFGSRLLRLQPALVFRPSDFAALWAVATATVAAAQHLSSCCSRITSTTCPHTQTHMTDPT